MIRTNVPPSNKSEVVVGGVTDVALLVYYHNTPWLCCQSLDPGVLQSAFHWNAAFAGAWRNRHLAAPADPTELHQPETTEAGALKFTMAHTKRMR